MAEVPKGVSRSDIQGFDYDKFLSNFSNVIELRRIAFRQYPFFGIIFGYTNDKEEINQILELDTKSFIL